MQDIPINFILKILSPYQRQDKWTSQYSFHYFTTIRQWTKFSSICEALIKFHEKWIGASAERTW